MKLTIKDRLLIEGIFPKESNMADRYTIKDIRSKVEISKEEKEKVNLRVPEGGTGIVWDNEADKDVLFTSAELNFLKKQVEALDKAGKINDDIFPLCQKIQEEKNESDT